ncbi:MAG: transketolase [Candidatus Humimicrobiaceae bacterium]
MEQKVEKLKKIANEIRINTFHAITKAGGGHYGGCLSLPEILTVLYFDSMNVDPKKLKDDSRDRFILSKGHGGPALYATLAARGYIPLSALDELDVPLSKFPKHIDRLKLDAIDVSSGALGQGLSIAVGMAISLKQQKKPNRVYIVLGDGECNSGQVWEAAMAASKYHLSNIIAIVDNNTYQLDGPTETVMPLEPFEEKWKSFGWKTYDADGHDVKSLIDTINKAKEEKSRPTVIIANTTKGKGISFMENATYWHAGTVSKEQLNQCLIELEELK